MDAKRLAGKDAAERLTLDRIEDLEALQSMAIYMRGELQRLGSAGAWLVAALPRLLEEEICAAREGRSRVIEPAEAALVGKKYLC